MNVPITWFLKVFRLKEHLDPKGFLKVAVQGRCRSWVEGKGSREQVQRLSANGLVQRVKEAPPQRSVNLPSPPALSHWPGRDQAGATSGLTSLDRRTPKNG